MPPPSSDDLTLQLFIRSILESTGFEDAKARLGVVANEAALAAPKIDKAGKAGKMLGESFGGTRGPVADLTRIMLQNAGVMGASGEAAKAAGTAIYFLEGAARASTVAISAGVAAVALLLPKVVEWLANTKDQSEEQRKLVDEMERELPVLEEYAEKIGRISEGLRLQLEAARRQDLESSIAKRGELEKKIGEEADAYARVSDELQRLGDTIQRNFGSYEAAPEALRKKFEDLADAQNRNRNAAEFHRGELLELNEAIDAGAGVAATRAKALKEAEAAERAAADAVKRHKEIQADWLQDNKELSAFISERLRQQEEESQERDAERHMRGKASTSKERAKALEEESDKLLARGEIERRQAEIDRAVARQKHDQTMQGIADAGFAASTFASLFGQNKGIAIAEAIANTAAAAVAAGRDTPGPFWVRLVAIAAVAAAGLAQVQAIRGAKPIGFDDPFSDQVARQLGRTSAVDFVREFGGTFIEGVRAGMETQMARGGPTHVTYLTDRSRHIGAFHAEGIIGPNRTSTMKWLSRQLRVADNLEDQATIGERR